MKILLSGLIAGLSGMKLSGNGKESDLDNLKLNILNKNEMVEINGEGQHLEYINGIWTIVFD